MHPVVTCPRGHQWELAAIGPSLPAPGPVTCPVCGAVVEVPFPEDKAAGLAERQLPDPPRTGGDRDALTLAEPSSALPPALDRMTVAGYEILEELGRGGMG